MLQEEELSELKKNHTTAYLAGEYEKCAQRLIELNVIQDKELAELVEEERTQLSEELTRLETQLVNIQSKNTVQGQAIHEAIMEIRAGAGGDEAALFGSDLLHMYQKYSDSKGWEWHIIYKSENGIGGIKEVSLGLKGKGVFEGLQFETGVHRVQRIPSTEKNGRVHTSTASVAVLPLKAHSTIVIRPEDLLIETARAGGKGGQNVNKRETAVRIVHLPSGFEVKCTEERSQQKNKERAMQILSAKIEDDIRRKEHKEHADIRKLQIGTADRSEKIRTYNIPQDRCTDHRIKQSWYGIPKILSGNIAQICEALEKGEMGDSEEE
ncbi:MAG: PCRF domain-containing protein [Alphaproteobacteria bacterium]|nr:PCRF domain-containing protein [Alphaproteobacteria bacterium]